MRAIIYARFSSDKQSETSIDDQVRVCQRRADQDGFVVVAVHADKSISGATPINHREGGKAVAVDCMTGRCEVLLVEALDRLSRDSHEQEGFIRRVEHQGIRIIGVCDGYDSQASSKKVVRAVRGLVNEIYLDDLRVKTHRGMTGQVVRGFHAGGVAYGYKSTPVNGGHKLEIFPPQSEWVEWIFSQFVGGMGCRSIAVELNNQGAPSPRGKSWAVSAIYGHQGKGTGILNNELYIGRYIWNRSQWIKDPDTKKRQRFERPKSEWSVAQYPELRIIADELWAQAKARQKASRLSYGTNTKGGTPTTLLGGLLRCGECGAPMIAANKHYYACSWHKDRGPTVCGSRIHVPRKIADERIIEVIRTEILGDDAIKHITTLTRKLLDQERKKASSTGDRSRRRLSELDKEIDRLTDAIAATGLSRAIQDRLAKAEAERDTLLQEQAPAISNIPDFVPRTLERFQQTVKNMNANPADIRRVISRTMGDLVVVQDQGEIFAECRNLYDGIVKLVVGNGSGGRIWHPATPYRIKVSR